MPRSLSSSKEAGPVADFKQVRDGSARSIIVTLAGRVGGAKLDEILTAIKQKRGRLMFHLHCMNRDCGYGYEVDGDRVTVIFPGQRTWRDAIRPVVVKPVASKRAHKKSKKKTA